MAEEETSGFSQESPNFSHHSTQSRQGENDNSHDEKIPVTITELPDDYKVSEGDTVHSSKTSEPPSEEDRKANEKITMEKILANFRTTKSRAAREFVDSSRQKQHSAPQHSYPEESTVTITELPDDTELPQQKKPQEAKAKKKKSVAHSFKKRLAKMRNKFSSFRGR